MPGVSWRFLVGEVVWGLVVGVVVGYVFWGLFGLAVGLAFVGPEWLAPVARLAFWVLVGLMGLVVFAYEAPWVVVLVYGGLALLALWLGFRRPEAAFRRGFWTGFCGVVVAGLVFNWVWFYVWRLPLYGF